MVGAMNQLEEGMMDAPHDEDGHEADHIGQERRPLFNHLLLQAVFPVPNLGDGDPQYQERDSDGKDAIAECLQAACFFFVTGLMLVIDHGLICSALYSYHLCGLDWPPSAVLHQYRTSTHNW